MKNHKNVEAPEGPDYVENLGNYHSQAHANYGANRQQKHYFRGQNTF